VIVYIIYLLEYVRSNIGLVITFNALNGVNALHTSIIMHCLDDTFEALGENSTHHFLCSSPQKKTVPGREIECENVVIVSSRLNGALRVTGK